VALEETIAQLKEECQKQEQAGLTAGFLSSGPLTQGDQPLEINPVYQSIRIQLSNAEVELAEVRARIEAQQRTVAQLRSDVDKITEVETQLKQLNRDYDVVQGRHQELLRRWEDLQAKKRLDPVTDNVQFRRIEPPFAKAEPVGPNRPLLLASVLLVALGGGGALALGLNQMNPVFFTRLRLRRITPIPVLGTITMILDDVTRNRRRNEALGWGGVALLLIVSSAAAVVFAPQAAALMQAILRGASV
jgi:hypothetical protein